MVSTLIAKIYIHLKCWTEGEITFGSPIISARAGDSCIALWYPVNQGYTITGQYMLNSKV